MKRKVKKGVDDDNTPIKKTEAEVDIDSVESILKEMNSFSHKNTRTEVQTGALLPTSPTIGR